MPNPPFPSESNRLAAIADAARRLPAPEPAADSLDAAWAEAEAALPDWWVLSMTGVRPDGHAANAMAWNFNGGVSEGCEDAHGDTPAAALRALAARLRERAK